LLQNLLAPEECFGTIFHYIDNRFTCGPTVKAAGLMYIFALLAFPSSFDAYGKYSLKRKGGFI